MAVEIPIGIAPPLEEVDRERRRLNPHSTGTSKPDVRPTPIAPPNTQRTGVCSAAGHATDDDGPAGFATTISVIPFARSVARLEDCSALSFADRRRDVLSLTAIVPDDATPDTPRTADSLDVAFVTAVDRILESPLSVRVLVACGALPLESRRHDAHADTAHSPPDPTLVAPFIVDASTARTIAGFARSIDNPVFSAPFVGRGALPLDGRRHDEPSHETDAPHGTTHDDAHDNDNDDAATDTPIERSTNPSTFAMPFVESCALPLDGRRHGAL